MPSLLSKNTVVQLNRRVYSNAVACTGHMTSTPTPASAHTHRMCISSSTPGTGRILPLLAPSS